MMVRALLQRLRADSLRWLARSRRARGRYDRVTRRLFQRAQRTAEPRALLDYLRFRRDLGHTLHPRFAPLLRQHLAGLGPEHQWQAAALLAECHPPALGDPSGELLGTGITDAAPRQAVWRDEFRRAVLAARSIAVVGNAGLLAGSGLGPAIDSAGMVVRFNHWSGAAHHTHDIGNRITAWVTAPSYPGPPPQGTDWHIVSGPDACYHLRNWTPFEPRLQAAQPVLTVPLAHWRSLVRTLEAPPSAGVLMLAWLHDLLGGWEGVTAIGIGTGGRGRYHLIDARSRPSPRHAWAKEAALVQGWGERGLRLLLRQGEPLPLAAP